MPIVSVRRFTSLSAYQHHNGRGGVQVDVDCSVADLARYSLHNGSYAGHVIRSRSGRRFYRSIPRFALAYDSALDSYVMRMIIASLKVVIKLLFPFSRNDRSASCV